jgi:general secretion pathway protein C
MATMAGTANRTVSNKLPLAAMFGSFVLLCASLAYSGMQTFRPPVRAVAAPMQAASADAPLEAAASLFGGRSGGLAVASNYQLKGVVVAADPRESIAIIGAEGKPIQSVRVNTQLQPGVTITEVHRQYVLLSEGGVSKRVSLPENAKPQQGNPLQPAFTPPPVMGNDGNPGVQQAPPSMGSTQPPPQLQPQPPQPMARPNQ